MKPFDGASGLIPLPGSPTGNQPESLFMRRVGRGSRHVVLVPGNNCSGAVFNPLLRRVAESPGLFDAFSFYAPDYRGSGLSTYHSPIRSLTDFARDFEQALDQIADLPETGVTLAGYSMGAAVALEMMTLNPGRYGALISLAGVGPRGLRMAFADSLSGTDDLGNTWAPGDWPPVDDERKAMAALDFRQRRLQNGGRTYQSLQIIWDLFVYNDVLGIHPKTLAAQKPRFRQHPDYINTFLDALTVHFMPESSLAIHQFNLTSTALEHTNADGTKIIIPGNGRLKDAVAGKKILMVKGHTDYNTWRGDLVIGDGDFAEAEADFRDAGCGVTALLIPPGRGYDHGFPVSFPRATLALMDGWLNGAPKDQLVTALLCGENPV